MGTYEFIEHLVDSLWVGSLAASPLAIVVGCVCRWRALRPATRHLLWFAVLASFVTPAVGAWVWTPHWFHSDQLIAAADSVLLQDRTTLLPDGSGRPAEPAIKSKPDTLDQGARALRGLLTPVSPGEQPAVLSGAPSVAIADEPIRFDLGIDTEIGASDLVSGPALPLASLEPQPAANRRSVGRSTSSIEPASQEIRAWLVRLLSVRDAVAALPPVPTAVWLGGALVIVCVRLARTVRARLWINRATPADPEVQAAVRRMGDALGLARAPRAVFVEATVSPMIWCGLRPILVLPAALWQTLDEDSRRAVLAHELAHIRRWDHVVCWVEGAIGALYWWHPIVWWARHRLRDEAESSCDAWVTSLFPSGRRAYASALVVTGSYLSTRRAASGPWLGVASTSSRRLARRITMVMTQKAAPRLSKFGALVAALVMTTGTFVMPGLACPPEREKTSKHEHKDKAHKDHAGAPAPDVTFFGEAPALEAMRGRALHAQPPTPPAGPAVPAPPAAPRAPKGPRAVAIPYGVALPAGQAPVAISIDGLKEGRSPRQYTMSSGKLEAFAGLMSRNDVPVLIEMQDDHIVIWATDHEHDVFQRFVAIIGGEGQPAVMVLPPGQAAPRARSGEVLRRQQTLQELARTREHMRRDAERAREEADAVRERADELRGLADTLRDQASETAQMEAKRELERAMKALASQSEALENESTSMESRLEAIEAQIEAMEAQIDHLVDEIEDAAEGEDDFDVEAPEDDEGAFIDEMPETPEPAEAPVTPEPAL